MSWNLFAISAPWLVSCMTLQRLLLAGIAIRATRISRRGSATRSLELGTMVLRHTLRNYSVLKLPETTYEYPLTSSMVTSICYNVEDPYNSRV